MNLRTHKRRACAGMACRRIALTLPGMPDDAYPTLHWTRFPWSERARSGKRPVSKADHYRYRPGSW